MKNFLKMVSLIIAAVISFSALSLSDFAAFCGIETGDNVTARTVLNRKYDYNGDGRRDIADVSAQLNRLADENSYIAPDALPDVNGDGIFNIVDVSHFLNLLANNEALIREIIDGMTLYEKICQLFIVYPEAITGVDVQTAAGTATENAMKQYPVGGFVFSANNLKTKEQTTTMLSNMTKYSNDITGLPIFLCVDEEGGRVTRVAKNSAFGVDNVGSMAEIGTEEEAYNAGAYIGGYLKELGFNVDFAPVADVITNPLNKVIGDRSFGTDPETVAKLAVALSNGLHSSGILSAMKHFPGHGGTEGDTHAGYAYSSKTKEELLEAELVPFMAGANKGVDFVMVAHIALPNVTGNEDPCTLSKQVITGILREELHYEGLIITDALEMSAITKEYTSKEAAVQAFLAGNDILLMPRNFKEALAGMEEAVADGTISEERINESLSRIIAAKLAMAEE